MKTKLFLAVLLFHLGYTISAQVATTPPSTIDSIDAGRTVLKQYKKLKAKVDLLKTEMEKSDQEIIGVLNAKFTGVQVYSSKEPRNTKRIKESEYEEKEKIAIDKINIIIKDGYINDISIYAKDKKYTNKFSPIGLTHKRFSSKQDKIELIGSTDFIILQQVITLDSLKQYVPDDVSFTLDAKKKSFNLEKGVGVNNIFDIRLYSDALALFGDEENGLVQTDFRYKNILHRRNFSNTGMFALQYIKVNMSASKFDSKDKFILASEFKNSDLIRKSYFNAEGAINLYNGWVEFKSMSKFYIDAGAGIGAARIKTENDSINVSTSNFFVEGGLCLKSSSNIGLDINARLIRLFSPSTKDYADYLDKRFFNFIKFSADFYWHPFKEEANRLFARVNYYTPTNDSVKAEDFFQFQIGYSILLSDLIK
jgi:hypothetical protein